MLSRETSPATTPTTPPEPSQKRHLAFVDSLRGWAIVGVFLAHLPHHVEGLTPALSAALSKGALGVQLFFIASAFTIFLSLDSRSKKDRRPILAFFMRRIWRIAPLYWSGAVFYLWWYGTTELVDSPVRPTTTTIARGYLFLTTWDPLLFNGVAPGGWSINVEMNFYVLVPLLWLLITNGRRASFFAAFTLLVAMGTLVLRIPQHLSAYYYPGYSLGVQELLDFTTYWLPAQLPVFSLGIVVYWMFRQREFETPGLLVLAAITIVTIALPRQDWLPPVGGLAILMWCLSQSRFSFLDNRALQFIGTLSFSGYLTHFAALDVGRALTGLQPHFAVPRSLVVDTSSLAPDLRLVIIACLAAPLTLVMSLATHYAIEQPGIAAGRRLLQKMKWS